MAFGSVSGTLSALIAQRTLGAARAKLVGTSQALASGNRINRAADDISALSAATALQTNVSTLRTASNNVAQASSLLQVADGGLQQISTALDRLQEIAVQANSGALDDAARKGLNQEFQGLVEEIDRLAGNTNFNNVNLLDGSLSADSSLQTVSAPATQASGALNFTTNINAGETLSINGTTLQEGVDFTAGSSIQETLDSVVNALNGSNDPNLSQATFSRSGNSIQIQADAGGSIGNNFTIDQGGSTAAFTVTGDNLGGNGVFSLQGGVDNGISGNSVQANGTVGDSIIAPQDQQAASQTLRFTDDVAEIQDGDTIQIDDGEGGFTTFTFRNNAAGANDIQIGSSNEETVQNAVNTLNNYSGADDYGVRQLDFSRDGNDLVITNRDVGNASDVSGNPLNIVNGTTGGNLSGTALDNGATGGIDVSGVTNDQFVGEIQGFQAEYNSADNVDLSIEVGGETYRATISDTTPGANTTVRFTSESGGSFDVELAGGNGQSVANQADADTLASRFDAAFDGLNFTQNRIVDNFTATGDLVGSSIEIQADDFSNLNVDDVNVRAAQPGGGSAVVEVTVNGETFRSAGNLGDSIGAGESIELTSLNDPNKTITFNNGQNTIDLSSNGSAANFQNDLAGALGADNGGGGLQFQVGSSSDDAFNISIGDASTDALFDGQSLDVLTAGGAANALSVIGGAIDQVTSLRADIGSFQQAMDFTFANLESAAFNQEAARATLADTDIAATSTEHMLEQIKNQASISMIAQTNRLQTSMLDLLKG